MYVGLLCRSLAYQPIVWSIGAAGEGWRILSRACREVEGSWKAENEPTLISAGWKAGLPASGASVRRTEKVWSGLVE